jgi:hypothetical protein
VGVFGGTRSKKDLLAEVDRAAAALRGGAKTAAGMSALTKVGLVAVVAAVGAIAAASWSGAFKASPETRSVTVTAPQAQAPTITLPKVDGTTQTELAVLASGTGFDSGAKAFALWLADRLIWVGFVGLLVAAAAALLPFVRVRSWAIGTGVVCVIAMVLGIVAPLGALLLQILVAGRDHVMTNGLPPAVGH